MGRREFQFVEGSSSKFWAIELDGNRFTVTWGRIGTAGQTQTKEFSTDAEAKKQYDKMIAEKEKKGYTETAARQTSTPKPAPVSNDPKGSSTTTTTTATTTTSKPTTAKPAKTTDPKTAPPPPAPAPMPAVQVTLETTRTIDLSPADWAVATWKPRKPLEKPAVQPFDLESCVARVAKVPVGTYGWDWDWSTAKIPVAMSPEEVHFWLEAMAQAVRSFKAKELAERLAKQKFPGVTAKEAFKLIEMAQKQTSIKPEIILPMSNLMQPEELFNILADATPKRAHRRGENAWHENAEVVEGFEKYILPYLTEAQLKPMRSIVAPLIDATKWPTDHYNAPPAAFFLAAMLGLHQALLDVVKSWKDDFYVATGWDHTHYHQPQRIVLGLGSAPIVEAEMRRLKLPLNKPEYIRGWLATTEYAALDYVRDRILNITNREEAEKLIDTFALVRAPEAAAHMLILKLSSKAPKPAREWLDANLGCAIAGLIPETIGRGKLADAAIDHLRDLKRAGHGDLIKKAAGKEPLERLRREVIDFVEKSYQPFDEASTPQWLKDSLKDAPRPSKLPPWLPQGSLPLLAIGEHRLGDEHTLSVLGALQKSPLNAPHALLKTLRENAAPESRDAFAWRLFELWQAEGAPPKDKWAMGAIGHLGGDACVLKLTPLIRNWPGESQHQRAVFGLECLRAVGSDIALMQLNGVAQKLKFKGLKAKAIEYMESIATHRKMTRSELEDRIVPDCGLDEKGTRMFDFGPRQFRFVLGPDLKAMIKDADGKVKSDLPAKGSKDDAAKADEAIESWKLLKKQIREIGKVQAERLEQAMVTGRRWSVVDFELLLVKHPLMINFVRLLVWGGYDDQGNLKKTFRITEDQSYADQSDSGTDLKGIQQVGIVHPLHLKDDQKRAWGEILSDYEIVPPFEQIGRPIYTLEKGEEKEREITRFDKLTLPAAAVVYGFDKLGWTRGAPADGGGFYEHSKPFYAADITAIVQYEPGVSVGWITEAEDQHITNCLFVPGIYKPDWYPEHKKRLTLSDVDPVVLSEVLKDLTLIATKAK
jgi:predicted DNA-binding WGR domain protein